MEYTLDSVIHAQKVLQKKYNSSKISKEEVLINDLTQLTKKQGVFYFGVVSVGSNVTNCILKNTEDLEIITIAKNSQIILLFDSLICKDDLNVDVIAPSGQFRGFELYIE